MQLRPVFLGVIPGLFLGVRVLLAVDANVAKTMAGPVLMGVAGEKLVLIAVIAAGADLLRHGFFS